MIIKLDIKYYLWFVCGRKILKIRRGKAGGVGVGHHACMHASYSFIYLFLFAYFIQLIIKKMLTNA